MVFITSFHTLNVHAWLNCFTVSTKNSHVVHANDKIYNKHMFQELLVEYLQKHGLLWKYF